MSFYVNTTRFPAIVTLKVSGAVDLKIDIQIGANDVFETIKASTGHWDIQVRAGDEIDLIGQPDVVLVAVRSAP